MQNVTLAELIGWLEKQKPGRVKLGFCGGRMVEDRVVFDPEPNDGGHSTFRDMLAYAQAVGANGRRLAYYGEEPITEKFFDYWEKSTAMTW